MQQNEKSMPGALPRPRKAIVMVAATLLLGGTISEASAKTRHHHHPHHHHGHYSSESSLHDAHESIAPRSGAGRGFAGGAAPLGKINRSTNTSPQRL